MSSTGHTVVALDPGGDHAAVAAPGFQAAVGVDPGQAKHRPLGDSLGGFGVAAGGDRQIHIGHSGLALERPKGSPDTRMSAESRFKRRHRAAGRGTVPTRGVGGPRVAHIALQTEATVRSP